MNWLIRDHLVAPPGITWWRFGGQTRDHLVAQAYSKESYSFLPIAVRAFLWKTAVPGTEGKAKSGIEREVLDRPRSDVAAEASGRLSIEGVAVELINRPQKLG
jgi:hypothetical protein